MLKKKREYAPEGIFVGKLIYDKQFGEMLSTSRKYNANFIETTAREGLNPIKNEFSLYGVDKTIVDIFDSNRKCIFAAPHWGNYVKTFIQIGIVSNKRKFHLMRKGLWNESEADMYSRINESGLCEIDVARQDRNGLIRFVRGISRNSYGMTCFDLDRESGETMPVNVFNHTFNLAYKWIDIAWRTNSLICYIKPVTSDSQGPNVISVVDPTSFINIDEFRSESLRQGARSLELLVQARPWHWYMWERLPSFLAPADQFEE